MRVPLSVIRAAERRTASIGILTAHLDDVLIDVIAVGMVQVPVVQVVDMVAVADSSMSAPRTVPMCMVWMCLSLRGCHDGLPNLIAHESSDRGLSRSRRVPSVASGPGNRSSGPAQEDHTKVQPGTFGRDGGNPADLATSSQPNTRRPRSFPCACDAAAQVS
jgi:hypothetical protein